MQKLFIKTIGGLFPVTTVETDAKANELCSISNLSVIDNNDATGTVYLAPPEPLRPTEEPETVFVMGLNNGNLYAKRKDLTEQQFNELDLMMPDFKQLGVAVMNDWLFSENESLVAHLDTVIASMMPKFNIEEWKADIYTHYVSAHHD